MSGNSLVSFYLKTLCDVLQVMDRKLRRGIDDKTSHLLSSRVVGLPAAVVQFP